MNNTKRVKMIPKIIHYCWFGKKPIPDDRKKCIESWKIFLPDFEIKEWNEDNWDVYKNLYSTQAYGLNKFEFVSDVCRFDVINQYGGIYFDTDVELIKDPTPIIEEGPFVACENEDDPHIATGLGFASESNSNVIKDIIDYYNNISLFTKDGLIDMSSCVIKQTDQFKEWGFIPDNTRIQKIRGFNVYPTEYFCPCNPDKDTLNITNNTYSIHHYHRSWKNGVITLYK